MGNDCQSPESEVDPVKIAFLVPSLTRSQVTRAFPFAKMLSEDHEVSVIGPSDPGHEPYLSDSRVGLASVSGRYSLMRAVRMIPMIRHADVVVVCKPVFDSVAVALAVRGKARLVFDLDDDDVEMVRQDVMGEGIGRRVAGMGKILMVSIIFRLSRLADATMVASRYLQDKYGGLVMPIPVDLGFLRRAEDSDEPLPLPTGRPLIVFIGVVRRHKGISELVESFPSIKSAFPGAVLLIAGSTSFGRYPKEVMARAAEVSADIVFLGHLEHPRVWRLMTHADVLVCPNPDTPAHRAQTPIKVMEYMAAGRPIMATPVGGARDVLEDGRLGTLSKSDSLEDIAESIIDVLRNPAAALEMARGARRAVETRYSFDSTRPAVEDLILGSRDG